MQAVDDKPAGLASLGHLEIAVMEILWEHGESNVHQVAQRLERPLAYTTVMTTLDRLYKKGWLERRKSERAYLYSTRQSREAWEHQAAEDFVTGYLVRPHPAGELLISCLVDAVGQNAKLLDELEKKIRLKRKELDRPGKS
ncbi:MAG TPA: BlaI/MecI/CopY family transcriptional regulator [Bryobacteraceae bacterium]|jgi:predicted transcriptional regulator|nr:BlaI/MecI/CopY family transcriptional regulator [Bryobacteraceae bacterium]